MLVSVLKAASYVTGNIINIYPRQMGYSIGLLHADALMGFELNKLTSCEMNIDATTICFTLCKASNVSLFYKILIHHDLVKLPETLYKSFYRNCHHRHHHHHNKIERLSRQLNMEFLLQ